MLIDRRSSELWLSDAQRKRICKEMDTETTGKPSRRKEMVEEENEDCAYEMAQKLQQEERQRIMTEVRH